MFFPCRFRLSVLALAINSALLIAQQLPPGPVATVKGYRGVPTLFLDGKPIALMGYMTYNLKEKWVRQFADAGITLFSYSVTATEHDYNVAPVCWIGLNQWDYSHIDQRSRLVLSQAPNAYLLPRVYLGTPQWWANERRNQLVTEIDTAGNEKILITEGKKMAASWASELWRKEAALSLRKFLQHVQRSSYGNRVIGYQLVSGGTEEWIQYGANERKWTDYSLPNLEKFHRW